MSRTSVLASIVALASGVSVWLIFQNTRWLIYGYSLPLSRAIPIVNPYASLDPVLEVPGLALAAAAAHVLFWQHVRFIWRFRHAVIRRRLMTRAILINGVILAALSVLGTVQWLVIGLRPWDLIALVIAGGSLTGCAYAIERSRRLQDWVSRVLRKP